MSTEEAPGTSSSYYSTASSNSNSSSVENISNGTGSSTIDNGDLSVFTFIMSKIIAPDLSHLPDQNRSCVHAPSCNCACRTNRFGRNESSSSLTIDPYGLSPNRRMICRGRGHHDHRHLTGPCKLCQSSIYDDPYSTLLGQNNLDGFLIRSLEKGVLYPVIHWSPKSNENLAQHTHVDIGVGTNSVVFNQGVYKELKRVIPPDAWIHKPSTESSEKSSLPKRPTWLVIGYKSLEKTLDSCLEATWKEWTGTRHIYLNLRHDFDIQRISFFNRVHPADNLDLFMYLVLMEIGNVDERNVMWLLDFVQRTRVERMKGFLTVYSEVENEFSTISDEYIKYFAAEVSKSKSADCLPEVRITNHETSGKKFIEKLLQEIHDTPLVDYF